MTRGWRSANAYGNVLERAAHVIDPTRPPSMRPSRNLARARYVERQERTSLSSRQEL
jgi:hypothetical protein